MKRTLSLVVLAAAASMAADIKYGVNSEVLLALPSVDGPDAKIGFGGNIGAGARIAVAEKFSVRPTVGFEFITHGTEEDVTEEYYGVSYSYTSETTLNSMFLTIGCGLEYSVLPNLFVVATPEYDLSLGGTYEYDVTSDAGSESGDGDIENEDNVFLIGLGLGYNINENIAVTAGFKYAVTEYLEEYKINKVAVGARYEL